MKLLVQFLCIHFIPIYHNNICMCEQFQECWWCLRRFSLGVTHVNLASITTGDVKEIDRTFNLSCIMQRQKDNKIINEGRHPWVEHMTSV